MLQGVQDDIKTLQTNVKSINSIAKAFIEDSDPEFSVSERRRKERAGEIGFLGR